MDNKIKKELYAEVLESLIEHLRNRNDVQNIDLMNLSGFCRNCLSKWYVNAADKRNIDINYEDAREAIYGMPYADWKKKYQVEATKEQLDKLNKKNSYKLSNFSPKIFFTLNLFTFIVGVIISFSIVNSSSIKINFLICSIADSSPFTFEVTSFIILIKS